MAGNHGDCGGWKELNLDKVVKHDSYVPECLFAGVCAVGNKIIAAPSVAKQLVVYDVESEEVHGVDVESIAPGSYRFSDVCVVGGKVVAAPLSADQLLVYDVRTGKLDGVDISEIGKGSETFWSSAACAVGNIVVMVPWSSNKLIVYDVDTQDLLGVDISAVIPDDSHQKKFASICSVGDEVVAAPAHSNCLLVYDVKTRKVRGVDVTTIAPTTAAAKFGGICAVGSKVIAAPAGSDQLLIYDLKTRELSGVHVSTIATGAQKFAGVCAVGSTVVAAPYESKQLLVYDVATNALQGVDIAKMLPKPRETGGGGFARTVYNGYAFSAICAVGHKVIAAPYDSTCLLLYDVASGELQSIDISRVSFGQLKSICPVNGKVVAAPGGNTSQTKLLIFDVQGHDGILTQPPARPVFNPGQLMQSSPVISTGPVRTIPSPTASRSGAHAVPGSRTLYGQPTRSPQEPWVTSGAQLAATAPKPLAAQPSQAYEQRGGYGAQPMLQVGQPYGAWPQQQQAAGMLHQVGVRPGAPQLANTQRLGAPQLADTRLVAQAQSYYAKR